MAEMLCTKLTVPPLRPNLVPPTWMIWLINDGILSKHKLSLDEADNDLRRFLAYLVAALQTVDDVHLLTANRNTNATHN